MTLRTDDGQTTGLAHLVAQLDVRTTTGHVGGNRHRAALPRLGHDVGLLLVELGVQHVVRYLAHLEHLAQHLGNLHRGRADQDRTSGFDQGLNLLDDRLVFLALRLVHPVVHVDTRHRTVRRNLHHVQLVDAPELAGLGHRRTGHTGQLMVHAEIVLQGDGGESLCGRLYLHMLLGLHRLMQAVAPASSVHDTARLLVHDFHLAVYHDILVVAVEHRVGLQELLQGVHTFALHGIFRIQLVFLHHTLLVTQGLVCLQSRHLGGDVRHDEQVGVGGGVGQPGKALVRKVHAVQLLVHHEVQRLHRLGHTLVVVLHVDFLGLQHTGLDALLREVLDQRLVLGQRLVAAVKLQEALLHLRLVARSDHLLGLGQVLRGQLALHAHQPFHQGLVLLEQLVVTLGYGTGNDQRRTRIVNQHRVHLVHDGIIVRALHQVLGVRGHVVTEIVETELVVRTKGDVRHVSAAAGLTVGLVLVDAVHAQAVEHIKRPHPFGVALGQIVVHRHHMHAVARQGVQEHRQGGHQRLTLARGHLGDFALVQDNAAEKLHVIVYHVPHRVISAGHPMVVVAGRVALDVHEIEPGRQLAVEIVGRDAHLFVGGKTLGRGLHDGEHHGQDLVQGLLVTFQHVFLQLVYLREERGTVLNRCLLHLSLHLRNLRLDVIGRRLHVLLHFLRLGAQLIVTQCLNGRISFLDFFHNRLNQLHVPRGLVAEKLAQKFVYIHISCFVSYSIPQTLRLSGTTVYFQLYIKEIPSKGLRQRMADKGTATQALGARIRMKRATVGATQSTVTGTFTVSGRTLHP